MSQESEVRLKRYGTMSYTRTQSRKAKRRDKEVKNGLICQKPTTVQTIKPLLGLF